MCQAYQPRDIVVCGIPVHVYMRDGYGAQISWEWNAGDKEKRNALWNLLGSHKLGVSRDTEPRCSVSTDFRSVGEAVWFLLR